MMTPREVLGHIAAEPFRPFRIHTASGRDFEVRHPEVVQVGRSTLTIFAPLVDLPDAEGTWIKLSLMLIESIEPMEVQSRTANN
jgi:hypothetical protein